jgi:NAD/NADP transhydrogenase beta subunit
MSDKKLKHNQFAELLDSKFTIPGTSIRFGIDPILGLIPGAGDLLGGLASLYFLFLGAHYRASVFVLIRMLVNILVDIIIGAVPLLGEVFDFGWKANLRNARLLNELQNNPAKTKSQSKIIVWAVVAISGALILRLIILFVWLLSLIIEFIS